MAIITRNGTDGKVCSTCDQWKPLQEFPRDRTHGATQGADIAVASRAIEKKLD